LDLLEEMEGMLTEVLPLMSQEALEAWNAGAEESAR
jgi:hypothetical protein